MIYEGYLYILYKCNNNPSVNCLKNLWNNNIKFSFVGNDIYHTLEKLTMCGKLKPDLKSLGKCFSTLTNLDLDIWLKIENGNILVGNSNFNGDNGLTFQIMKVDRYMGIASMEMGLIKQQVSVISDINGAYMFFLGLISSNVITLGNEYYFLLFDTSEILNCINNPSMWFSIKDKLKNDLIKTLNRTKRIDDDIISLETLLNTEVIDLMKKEGLEEANLRLLKINAERNTYKVYNDFPIQMFSNMKIYENMKFIKSLASVVDFLINRASDFLNGRDKGDGYHAYKALKYIYMFLVSNHVEYLSNAMREIYEASKINENYGYLKWISNLTITR